MSVSEDFQSGDEFRATRKAERRDKRREQKKAAPVVARYGVWTGEGYLREGEGLERLLTEQSVKPPSGPRRAKRRKHKKK